MAKSAYFPSPDEVNVNSTVTWSNRDIVAHTVTSTSNTKPHEQFDSGNIAPGKTWLHVFGVRDTFNYYCKLHPFMMGIISIK